MMKARRSAETQRVALPEVQPAAIEERKSLEAVHEASVVHDAAPHGADGDDWVCVPAVPAVPASLSGSDRPAGTLPPGCQGFSMPREYTCVGKDKIRSTT